MEATNSEGGLSQSQLASFLGSLGYGGGWIHQPGMQLGMELGHFRVPLRCIDNRGKNGGPACRF